MDLLQLSSEHGVGQTQANWGAKYEAAYNGKILVKREVSALQNADPQKGNFSRFFIISGEYIDDSEGITGGRYRDIKEVDVHSGATLTRHIEIDTYGTPEKIKINAHSPGKGDTRISEATFQINGGEKKTLPVDNLPPSVSKAWISGVGQMVFNAGLEPELRRQSDEMAKIITDMNPGFAKIMDTAKEAVKPQVKMVDKVVG